MNARGREYSGESNRRLPGRLTLATRAAVKNEGKEAGQTFGTDQKPIKFRRDPRAVDSPVHEIAIRFHADFDTLPSRRSAPPVSQRPYLPLASSHPVWFSLLGRHDGRGYCETVIVRLPHPSARASFWTLGLTYITYETRGERERESLATAAQ